MYIPTIMIMILTLFSVYPTTILNKRALLYTSRCTGNIIFLNLAKQGQITVSSSILQKLENSMNLQEQNDHSLCLTVYQQMHRKSIFSQFHKVGADLLTKQIEVYDKPVQKCYITKGQLYLRVQPFWIGLSQLVKSYLPHIIQTNLMLEFCIQCATVSYNQ